MGVVSAAVLSDVPHRPWARVTNERWGVSVWPSGTVIFHFDASECAYADRVQLMGDLDTVLDRWVVSRELVYGGAGPTDDEVIRAVESCRVALARACVLLCAGKGIAALRGAA